MIPVLEHCAVRVDACASVPRCCLTAASQAEGIQPRWMVGQGLAGVGQRTNEH